MCKYLDGWNKGWVGQAGGERASAALCIHLK